MKNDQFLMTKETPMTHEQSQRGGGFAAPTRIGGSGCQPAQTRVLWHRLHSSFVVLTWGSVPSRSNQPSSHNCRRPSRLTVLGWKSTRQRGGGGLKWAREFQHDSVPPGPALAV